MIVYWLLLLPTAFVAYIFGSLDTMVIASNFFFRHNLRRLGTGNRWLSNFRRIFGVPGFIKLAIAEILKEEGFIKNYEVVDTENKQGVINITLKYGEGKTRTIEGLRRVSKPGLRIYASCQDIPRVRNGLGIAIISTSKGIMTDKKARKENIGGEVLAFVW